MNVSKESLLQWTTEEERQLYKSEIFNNKQILTSSDSGKDSVSQKKHSFDEPIQHEALNLITYNIKNRSKPFPNNHFSL